MFNRKQIVLLSDRCDGRKDATRRLSRGREYLDFYEQSEIKSLVTRDHKLHHEILKYIVPVPIYDVLGLLFPLIGIVATKCRAHTERRPHVSAVRRVGFSFNFWYGMSPEHLQGTFCKITPLGRPCFSPVRRS